MKSQNLVKRFKLYLRYRNVCWICGRKGMWKIYLSKASDFVKDVNVTWKIPPRRLPINYPKNPIIGISRDFVACKECIKRVKRK